jgi:hypothetical protein
MLCLVTLCVAISDRECGVSLCVITKPRERGGHSPRWAAEPDKTINNNNNNTQEVSFRTYRTSGCYCVRNFGYKMLYQRTSNFQPSFHLSCFAGVLYNSSEPWSLLAALEEKTELPKKKKNNKLCFEARRIVNTEWWGPFDINRR